MAHSNPYRRGLGALMATAMLAVPLAAQPVLFSAPAQAHGQSDSIADMVATVKPGVVTVLTKSSRQADAGQAMPQLPDGPFKDFMERFLRQRPGAEAPQGEAPAVRGLGSGFIVDSDGYIVTNRHVVGEADAIMVVLDDGTELEARIVGVDDKTDLAVLQVKSEAPLTTVAWGDSDGIRVGDPVAAIGNPFGLGGTVTSGIVSARGRNIRSGPYDDYLQVDAAINRGNSGGPLFDHEGRVVGVNTAIYSPNGGNIGLGFAIPSNQARKIVAELIDKGVVERGFIGVAVQPVTPEIAESLGLAKPRGALVASVREDGPAARAGLKPGDVILSFGHSQVETARDIARIVADTDPGVSDRLAVWRDGEVQSLTIAVGRMEAGPRVAAAGAAVGDTVGALGLALAELDGESRSRLGLSAETRGVVVTAVQPDKPAAQKGIGVGDVILAVGQTRIGTVGELRQAIEKLRSEQRKSALLLVQHRGQQTYVAIPLAVA